MHTDTLIDALYTLIVYFVDIFSIWITLSNILHKITARKSCSISNFWLITHTLWRKIEILTYSNTAVKKCVQLKQSALEHNLDFESIYIIGLILSTAQKHNRQTIISSRHIEFFLTANP